MKRIINRLFRQVNNTEQPKAPIIIDNLQRKIADYLNHKTARWSRTKSRIVLYSFCLIAGNMCLYVSSGIFLHTKGPPAAISIKRITVPKLRHIEKDTTLNNH